MIDQKHTKFVKTFQNTSNGRQQFVLNLFVKKSLPLNEFATGRLYSSDF